MEMTIKTELLPIISYAMQQNGAGLVRSVAIDNPTDTPLEHLELEITADCGFILPFHSHIDLIPQKKTVTISQPKVILSGEFLAGLTEKLTGVLTVTLRQNDTVLAASHEEVTVLAFDEWQGLSIYPELLASFVTPNHPELPRIIGRAADILGHWTGDNAMDAYQSQDPNRVLRQAGAIFTALKEQSISYAVAPASFEQSGQRVRLCDAVLTQKLGTCLDLTLLYAACLEAVGLHPLLIATEGHIFTGLWLEDRMFPECVQDDVSLIQKRLASGISEIAVMETTCLTSGKDLSFDQARSVGEQNLVNQNFECVIDVHRARMSRITPLPQRFAAPGGWVIREAADISRESRNAPRELDETIRIDSNNEQSLPKKAQWERKLLDLGLRNTLINLRLTKTQLPILTNSLDALEDALQGGSDFTIHARPTDLACPEFSFEAIHELGSANIVQAEFANKRLRSILTENELSKSLKDLYRSARTALEENGANTLYLALGMLRWYESKRSTKARYAPIVLLPIEMVRRSAAQGYVIRLRDEEPQMNITLLEKLKQDLGIVIHGVDPLPADDHGVDIRRVLTIVRKAVMDQPRWDVLETASLGIFSFSQFVMWNDIRNRSDDLMRNKVVRSLMEGKLSWEAEPLEIGDRVSEEQVLLPMSADASQLHAISAACEGRSFVLHGPPGTGKSQTITSLIANALAQGKRVLFVAEKLAALEVVEKRLDSIGIGPFCLELHSNKSKKKDVLEQLRHASEVTKTQSAASYAAKAQQISSLRAELDDYARQLHTVQPCGSTLYTLIGTYEGCKNAPDLAPFDAGFIRSLDAAGLDERKLTVERLIAAGKEIGHPAGHPLAVIGCTQYSQTLKTNLRPAAERYTAALDTIMPQIQSLSDSLNLGMVRSYEDLRRICEIAENLDTCYGLPDSWTKAEDPGTTLDQVTTLVDHASKAESLKNALLAQFEPAILAQNGEQLLSEYNETTEKWFLPKMLGTGKLAKLLNSCAKSPISKEQIPEHLTALGNYQSEQKQADDLMAVCGTDLGDAPDWAQIADMVATARSCIRDLDRLTSNAEIRKQHCGSPALRDTVSGICSKFPEFREAKLTLDQLISPVSVPADNWHQAQKDLCNAVLNHADQLKEWIAYSAAAKEAKELGLDNVVGAYTSGMDHDSIYPAFRKATLVGLIREAIDDSDTLNGFSGAVFNQKIEQYKRMDQELTALVQQEIYCRLASRVPDFTREAAHSSELGILQRCIKSGGRGTSIRRLFDQIPNMLPRLCPCMLMSPISAAQYLDPKSPPFDIVVFDEASQLPTCKAVGVLARGTEAVIVGDPKQMPPTSFFSTNTVDEDELETEDLESILDDCLALNMPQAHLLWHYRSRHESLIAFSNREFYENKLFTFPSVNDRASMVTLRHIEGSFDRGKSRTNQAEAQAVLEELLRRYRDPVLSKQSIGVVTFNISQQHLIDDLLSEACAKDPALEKWAYSSAEPLFIKNLENVQGDERDVILFSIGFGPDLSGKVHMNFGPLNRDGGWRRLNVAVSRARCEMMVFSALRPDQLDLNRTKAEGVAALRKFLEYAEGRTRATEASKIAKQTDDGIARSIRAALKEQGYDADLNVGRSEYRIDIGIIDPAAPEQYRLGILLDGPGYGGAKTTRDRELAQISVLQGLGWNILRIWTMDWWDNREKELARILKTLQELPTVPAEPEVEPAKEIPATLPEAIPEPPVYRAAILPMDTLTAEEFLEPRYFGSIEQKIEAVIQAEAPISVSLLTRRVIQSYGISRAGSRIQAHMDKLISRMKLPTTTQEEGKFCWNRDQDPESYTGFRISGEGDSRRDIRDVPVQEIANAMCAVLNEQISMSRDDLLRETAGKLGYTRLGSNVVSCMVQGFAYAESRGTITTSPNGAIILSK